MTGSRRYLRYWEPTTDKEVAHEVSSTEDIWAVIDIATERYRIAGATFCPGIAIWHDAETPENSLTVCVAPDGWAVVHTDEEFDQRVTRSGRESDGTLFRAFALSTGTPLPP